MEIGADAPLKKEGGRRRVRPVTGQRASTTRDDVTGGRLGG